MTNLALALILYAAFMQRDTPPKSQCSKDYAPVAAELHARLKDTSRCTAEQAQQAAAHEKAAHSYLQELNEPCFALSEAETGVSKIKSCTTYIKK